MQHGSELTEFRQKKFWTVAMLANELGVTRATVWRWEKSKTLPNTCIIRLKRWAKANKNWKPDEPTINLVPTKKRGRPSVEQL